MEDERHYDHFTFPNQWKPYGQGRSMVLGSEHRIKQHGEQRVKAISQMKPSRDYSYAKGRSPSSKYWVHARFRDWPCLCFRPCYA